MSGRFVLGGDAGRVSIFRMRARKSKLIIVAIVAALFIAATIVLASHYDLRAQMAGVVDAIREKGPLPFFAAMALLPVVGFPMSAFTLVAGPVFGPTMGVAAVVGCGILAITANVAFSYWISAHALRPVVSRFVQWIGYPLPEIQPRSAWTAIVVIRVVPITPFCLQSILLGLARVPFGPYMLVSVLVPSAYATAMIVLGDGLMRGDRWAMAGAGVLFVIVGVILHILRKRLRPSAAKTVPTIDRQRS
jgi:uncharacterized membrane protein YdjX (TVP38/TMEM64 family)